MGLKQHNTSTTSKRLNLYFSVLYSLNLDFELQTIETSFGDTNVVVTGAIDYPPLVLVHGYYSCAPLALQNVKGLENHFRIYAVDILGHPNLSDQIALSHQKEAHQKWIYEVLGRLKIYNAFLVGFGIGGFIGLKALVGHSNRFKKAVFINPAGIIKPNFFKFFLKVQLPIFILRMFNNEQYLTHVLQQLYVGDTLFLNRYLKEVLSLTLPFNFKVKLLSRKEVGSITTPIYLMASEDGLIFCGKKLIKRAKYRFPTLEELVQFKNTPHLLSEQVQKNMLSNLLQILQK